LRIGRSARKLSKSPRVYTSDPESKETRLTLTVQAVANFDSTAPLAISMDKVVIPPDQRADRFNLKVKNISDQSVSPEMLFSPNDIVDIQLPASIGPGEDGNISLAIADGFEWKNTRTSFTFEAGDGARYTIPVEVGKFSTPKPVTQKSPSAAASKPGPGSISSQSSGDKQPIRPTSKKEDDGK
jgi:hypothetical protein